MSHLIWLALFLPLAGFLILMIASHVIPRRPASLIACTTIALSFLCFTTYLVLDPSASAATFTLFTWLPIPAINANFSVHIDSLSLLMAFIITGVGFLIHVYSVGYMEHDQDYARYFACLNFFIFSMLLLVLASHLLLLFVGWEGVGLASYLLIGFYYPKPEAAAAATKAFVVNRIGDLGMLLGLLLTFYLFATGEIAEINRRVATEFAVGAPVLTILTLLYFIGASGKSAQIPLHVWLPDAMEGPTPVSALIHAATMVTAGVYLVVRMHPVYEMAPTTLYWVAIIGAATALFAALCALSQTDLKRVLAYSTVSQLGYMFLACGVGAYYAAMFHLTAHAFVKGLLFLAAGNVVHMLHGTTEMKQMGGLSKALPKTSWLFLIGALALSGIPPLVAFFSKDLILEQVHLRGFGFLFAVGMITAILTAFYLMRAYFLTFRGPFQESPEAFAAIKEAHRVMLIPVGLLALLSIGGGFLGFAFSHASLLERFLAKAGVTLAVHEEGNMLLSPLTWLSVAGAIFGVVSAAVIYTRYRQRLGHPVVLFKRAFFVDDLYRNMLVVPLHEASRVIVEKIEPNVFDGSLKVVSSGAQDTAQWLQKMQSGETRSYIAWMTLGIVALLIYLTY